MLVPQLAVLELQQRQRERRGAAVAASRRAEPARCVVQLPALPVNPCHGGQRVEVGVTLHGQPPDREGLVVAPECLIDRGALRIEVDAVAA